MRTPDEFLPLSALVEMRAFGDKSIAWLREVAWLQTQDPEEWRRRGKRVRASWSVVQSYPRFVRDAGGKIGLYRSQLIAHQAERMAC